MSGFSFGSTGQQTTGFGTSGSGTSFGFGSSAPRPTFGGFGTSSSTAAPAFGTGAGGGFGTGTSGFGTSGTTFGTGGTTFGAGTGTTGFGTPGTTGFGSSGTTGFGSTGFGTSGTSGFGTTGNAFGGMGSSSTGFGSGSTTFGSTGAFGTGSSTFGTGTSTGFGGFGTQGQTQPCFGGFGAKPQQPERSESDMVIMALTDNCKVYGDERDAVLTRWNQLQAFWGAGKGWYSGSQPPVVFKPTNAFARFKSVVYRKMYSAKDEQGLVGLIINKPYHEVELAKVQFQEGVLKCLNVGGMNLQQQNLKVAIDSMKPMPENKTDVVIYITERTGMGTEVRVPAKKLYEKFKEQNIAQNLATQLGVQDVEYRCRFPKEDVDALLEIPPCGMEPIMWEQGKKDNPDPTSMIPQVVMGFDGLLERFQMQSLEAEHQALRVDIIADSVAAMKDRSTALTDKLNSLRVKQKFLAHRVLKLLSQQEISRKQGQSLTREEEDIFGARLEALFRFLGLSRPMKDPLAPSSDQKEVTGGLLGKHQVENASQVGGLRARLNALMAQTKLCPEIFEAGYKSSTGLGAMSAETCQEFNQVLESLTKGILLLQTTLKEDLKAVEEVKARYEKAVSSGF